MNFCVIQQANRVGNLKNGNGLAYFRENNINAIHARYPLIPRSLVAFYFDTAFSTGSNVVKWFNNAQEEALNKVHGGNIVQLDIDGLFRDVLNDPLSYGIDEILVPECSIGHVALFCDLGDSFYHGDDGRRYMFTDWHHLSALMHRIIAEYAIATVNTPAYMTGLSRSLETGVKARQDYLLSELNRINARIYQNNGNRCVFGGFSGGYSRQKRSLNNRAVVYNGFNIGYIILMAAGLDLGVIASLGINDMHPHHNLKYDQRDYGLSLFAQYSNGPWWMNGIVSGVKTDFDSIHRSIPLGKKVQIETSGTSGETWGGRVETGYEFNLGGHVGSSTFRGVHAESLSSERL